MIYEIIIDRHETPNQCTIAPLGDRADFKLFPVFGEGTVGPLSAPLLLHHEGQCLSEVRHQFAAPPAIACIDCVWRKLPKLVQKIAWGRAEGPLKVKIPDGFKTVYPRTGAPTNDPSGGLATIEALFVAAALLGKWDPTLLSKYYFGRKFVEANRHRFLELGVFEASDVRKLPPLSPVARDSLSRRRNRGRVQRPGRVRV